MSFEEGTEEFQRVNDRFKVMNNLECVKYNLKDNSNYEAEFVAPDKNPQEVQKQAVDQQL